MLDKNVLLLEAGVSVSFLPRFPFLGPFLQGSIHDWKYVTEPQEHACKAMNNRQSNWPRGKIFGGTHLLSNLIQMKGEPDEYRCYVDPHHKFDYDTDIGQYFREYESLMQVQRVPYQSELSRLLQSAGSEIEHHGFHQPNVSLRNGLRFTTATLYWEHAQTGLDRNHTLFFNAMVNRLHLGPQSGHVDRVEFTKAGVTYMAKARKAVILSAGAIGSPAILLRSGIGPKEHLKDVKIEPLIDLPVGEYLQDHVATGVDLVSLNTTLGLGALDLFTTDTYYKYFIQSRGFIALPGCDLVTTLKVLNGSRFNDLEFMVVPLALNTDAGMHLRKILNLRDQVYYDYFHSNEEEGGQGVSLLPVLLKPKSVGSVRLRSSDPQESPIIDPKYLTHPEDKQVLFDGIQMVKRLVETETMQKLGAKIRGTPFPGCEGFQFDTEEYWMCYIEHVTMTSYHPAGTCRMGSCPKESVVDYQFKVHGVDNLYVVDASVMPELPAANPIATINMLALRFVDRVLQ